MGDRSTAVGTFREFASVGEEAIYPEHVVLHKRAHHETTSEAGDDQMKSMAASGASCQAAEIASGSGEGIRRQTAGDGRKKPMAASAGDGRRKPMAARTRSASPTWTVDPVRASWRAPGSGSSSRARFE